MRVVVPAAVAAQRNERIEGRGTLGSVFVNPFKRQRPTQDQPAEEDALGLSRGESSEPGVTEGPEGERHVLDLSHRESSEQRDARDGVQRRSSNPTSTDTPPDSAGRMSNDENPGHETGVVDSEYVYDYAEEDEQYLLIPTPYPTLVRQFALVPITSALTMVILLFLLHGIWSQETWSSSTASYLGCFVFASAAWIVSFAFRIPLFLLSSFVCRPAPSFTPFFSTLVQALCEETVRLFALVLVHLRVRDTLHPSDHAFPRVWVLAMGWATIEVAVSVWQGYDQLAVYKDVLLPAHDPVAPPFSFPEASDRNEGNTGVELNTPVGRHVFEEPEGYMYKEIEQLIRVRARLELEEVYGIPVPNIPIFISCLQRIDLIILSLAIFLHMSSSYVQNVARQGVPYDPPPHLNYAKAIRDTLPTFFVIVLLHTLLSFIWSASILPRIGVHSASYIGVVMSLGALFAGLGRWNAL